MCDMDIDINRDIIEQVLKNYLARELVDKAIQEMVERSSTKVEKLQATLPSAKSIRYNVSNLRAESILAEYPNIKRGDVVNFANSSWWDQTNGTYMWDGRKVENLYYEKLYFEKDRHGSLPDSYTLNEFPDPAFFDDTFGHDSIRWISFDEIKTIKDGYFVVEIEAKGKRYNYEIKISSHLLGLTKKQLFKNFINPLPIIKSGEKFVVGSRNG